MNKLPPETRIVTQAGSFRFDELTSLQKLAKTIDLAVKDGAKLVNRRGFILAVFEQTAQNLTIKKPESYKAILKYLPESPWTSDIIKYVETQEKRISGD